MHFYCLTALFLLLTLAGLADSQSLMTSCKCLTKLDQYQLSVPHPHLVSGSSQTLSFPPSIIHQGSTQYFVVVSGHLFAFNIRSCLHFKIASVNSVQIRVTMQAECGNLLYLVKFYLVAINPNNYLWMKKFQAWTQYINIRKGASAQHFYVQSPVVIQDISDFTIIPFICSWQMESGASYMMNFDLIYYGQLNLTHIIIEASKVKPTRIVSFFRSTILWVNNTALYFTNRPRYFSQFVLNQVTQFTILPSMFGIPQLYYPNNSTIEPRCIIGIVNANLGATDLSVFVGGSYLNIQFNTKTNPFTGLVFETPLYQGLPQIFRETFKIFCFQQVECPPYQYFHEASQTCATCPFAHFFNLSNHVCQSCGFACIECLDGYCSHCVLGKLINGKCSIIPGCIDFIQFGSSQTCIQCDYSQFQLNISAGICQCFEGTTLFDGECVPTINGCLSYWSASDGSHPCLFCNVLAFFSGLPNSEGHCSCRQSYNLVNNKCIDVCGDGLLEISLSSECDDGNTDDGDGCSSSCKTQKFYKCQNNSDSSPSVCVYRGFFLNVTLNKTRRVNGANSGEFIFMIHPALLNLRKMNFSKYTLFNCNSTFEITSILYDNYGKLSIAVDYSQDMEDRHCTFILAYDTTIVDKPDSQLSFNVKSQNVALIISNKIKQYQRTKFIFEIIALIALGIFLIGLPRKMLGVEALSCCQISFLSLYLYEKQIFLYTALQGQSPVTGGWYLFSNVEESSLLPGFTDRITISSEFIKNYGIIAGALVVIVLLWGVLMQVKYCSCQADESDEQKKQSNQSAAPSDFLSKGVILIYNWLMFPIAAGFFMILIISAFLNDCRFLTADVGTGLSILGSLAMLFVFILIGSIMGLQFFENEHYGGANSQPSANKWYIPMYLGKTILVANLFVLGFSTILSYNILTYSLMATEVIFILYLIIKRPYRSGFMNLGAIFCQVSTIYALGLPIIHRFYTPSEDTEVLLLFVLQGLLLLAEALTFVRVIISFYNSIKSSCFKTQKMKQKKKRKVSKKDKKINEELQEYNRAVRDSPFKDIAKKSSTPRDISSRGKQGKCQNKKINLEEQETLRMIKENLKNDFYEKQAKKKQLLEFS